MYASVVAKKTKEYDDYQSHGPSRHHFSGCDCLVHADEMITGLFDAILNVDQRELFVLNCFDVVMFPRNFDVILLIVCVII